jgi:hypothetical protein
VFRGYDLARLGRELGTNLTAPRAIFEGLVPPRCILNGRDIPPSLIVTWAVTTIDPYNDFISEGGKIWPRIKTVAEANNCVAHMPTRTAVCCFS